MSGVKSHIRDQCPTPSYSYWPGRDSDGSLRFVGSLAGQGAKT
ncbi:hypothetical protein [Arthrobacter sp. efr-133-TYG-104]|nr:hypothetical protein [Arthrobacter sp. efr-133-TYG-104]